VTAVSVPMQEPEEKAIYQASLQFQRQVRFAVTATWTLFGRAHLLRIGHAPDDSEMRAISALEYGRAATEMPISRAFYTIMAMHPSRRMLTGSMVTQPRSKASSHSPQMSSTSGLASAFRPHSGQVNFACFGLGRAERWLKKRSHPARTCDEHGQLAR
jgi:hypothetical protein